jgi:hypothetical protein
MANSGTAGRPDAAIATNPFSYKEAWNKNQIAYIRTIARKYKKAIVETSERWRFQWH